MEDLPVITVTGGRRVEAFDQLQFTVSLSAVTTGDVTLDYRTLGATAIESLDFDGESGRITIPAGETTATFNVRTRGDDLAEPDEDFVVEFSNVAGATFPDGALTARTRGVIEDDDTAETRPSLFVGDVRIVEGNAGQRNAVFDVELSRTAPQAITLNYTTVDGSARAGEDFVATSGALTFDAGETQATVAVPVTGDPGPEGTENFTLAFTPTGAVANGAQGAAGTGTILDDDARGGAQPVVSLTGSRTIESFNQTVFAVSLSAPTTRDVTVDYRAFTDSAFEERDFDPEAGSVTIAAGETLTTFTVRARSDNLAEADENFVVELTNAEGAVLAGNAPSLQANGTILDKDGGDTRPSLFVGDVRLIEGAPGERTAVFDIQLSRPAETALGFAYTTVDGSATAGRDYEASAGQVAFAPGQTHASVFVPVLGDVVPEVPETFGLALTPTGDIANGVQDAVGTATILDDDAGGGVQPVITLDGAIQPESFGQMDFAVRLSAPAARDVTVDFRAFPATALEGVDFDDDDGTVTIAAGDTVAFFNVRVRSDNLVEADENIVVELTNADGAVMAGGDTTLRAAGVIVDEDGNEQRPALFVSDTQVIEGRDGERLAVFDVLLSRPSASAIELNYTTVDGDAVGGVDFADTRGSLTLAPGQTRAGIAVPVFGDSVTEATEAFSLAVTGPGTDVFARGATGLLGTARILDDDAGGGSQPVISIDDATRLESFSQLDFSVHLSAPAPNDVTVEYRTLGGTADEGNDFDSENGTLVIPAGDTSGSFNVRARQDNDLEPAETFSVELLNAQGAVFAAGGTTLRGTGTILDDEQAPPTAGVPVLTVDDVTVQEPASGTTNATFTLSLPSPAALNVTGDYEVLPGTANAGADFTPVSGSFAIAGGQRTTTVDVPLRADNVQEDAESFVLRLDNLNNAQFSANADELVAIATIEANVPNNPTLPLLDLTLAQQVSAVYVAYFGRGADPAGVDFWVGQLASGLTGGKTPGGVMKDIASSFALVDETRDTFPFLLDPAAASRAEIGAFVDDIFQNLFNRGAEGSVDDPTTGLGFWTQTLEDLIAGPAFVGNAIIDIVSGARNTANGNDIATVRNKIDAGLSYADTVRDLGAEFTRADDAADARSVIADVTDDPATLAAARDLAVDLVRADIDLLL